MTTAAILLATALSAGNAEFDRTAAENAAEVAMKDYAAEIAAKGLEPGRMAGWMLEDAASHRSRGESESVCKGLFAGWVREAYQARLKAVRERLGLDDTYAPSAAAGIDEAVERAYKGQFDAERSLAVKKQAEGLATALRPTEREFDEKPMDELRGIMTERIVAEQKTAVFDENRDFVTTELVEPVLASGSEERSRQIEFLKRAKSDAAAPSAISAELKAKLEMNVTEHAAAAEPSKAWGVFPSVVNDALPKTVEHRVVKAFAGRMGDVELVITTNDVLSAVALDKAAHFKAADSEKAFASSAIPKVLAEAYAKVCADAPESQRSELAAYLEDRFGDDEVKRAAERQIKRDALPKWRKARAELAEHLASETWPTLLDGTWHPDPETADAIAARSDWRKAVGDWRKIPALADLAAADALGGLIEESAKVADAKVATAFDIARSAIASQSAIVDEVHPAILADSRERKESFFRRTPDLAAITARLTAATEEKWGERRLGTLWPDGGEPANADVQHVELFPSVRRKIELVARQILEEMNKSEEETKKEEEPQEDEPEELLLTISAKRTTGGYELKLMKGKSVVSEERVPLNRDDFISGMDRLAQKLLPLL